MSHKKVPLVYIVTAPITADKLLRGQLRFLSERGFDITLITSPGADLARIAEREGVTILTVPLEREIDLLQDLRALWQLFWLLRKIKPTIVNASTPKAGMVGMLAAWLAGVPVRIYLLRGLRAETATGLKRLILGISERIATLCAHRVVSVSASLQQLYSQLRLAPSHKLTVLGGGSSNGVNTKRFLLQSVTAARVAEVRQQNQLPSNGKVVGFVGRFTRDKGIVELLGAFEQLLKSMPDLHLLLVGMFEEGDPVSEDVVNRIKSHPQITVTGFVADTAPYYHVMDIFAFPSYREGLPNAPLEAAMAGIPTVGFRATGVVDVILDGKTGMIVPTRSDTALAAALLPLLLNDSLRQSMGRAAQTWVINNYDATVVWEQWLDFYTSCLSFAGQPALLSELDSPMVK